MMKRQLHFEQGMLLPTREDVMALLRNGSAAERAAFLSQLPPARFKDAAASLFESDGPAMVVTALGLLIQEYCFGSNPQIGAVLAEATHAHALEVAREVKNHGILPTTLSGLACHHLRALSLLGRSTEVIEAADRYIPLYAGLNETENLPTLKVLRINALVNLQRIDEAAGALGDQSLLDDPVIGMEAKRLKGWVDRFRTDPTTTAAQWKPNSPGADEQSIQAALGKVLELGGMGKLGDRVREQLAPSNQDGKDPAQHQRLLALLREGESLLTRGAGHDSELAVRAKIREATAIFIQGSPATDLIRRSLADLEASLDWARRNAIPEHQNDALWGLYLCHNRLGQPSEAADALLELRGSLESLRRGIRDPMQRGGVFSTYKYLFNALCEQLHKSGRTRDFLEAIESSKGRVIADRLTASGDAVLGDAETYRSVRNLTALTRREGFHYLTYFVDETCVYAAFVSKAGEVLTPAPVKITNHDLRAAAYHADPGEWSEDIGKVNEQLAPLVGWLEELLSRGIVSKGDHIAYSSDDDFNNVPLHYLRFRDGVLLDYFSVSRVHSAFHLDRLMASERACPPGAYAGFVVPTRQDLRRSNADDFLKNLDAPLDRLTRLGLRGTTIRLSDATLQRLRNEALDHRIVHFSTHGIFPPEGGNPFRGSYLLLADENGLPGALLIGAGAQKGKLTPAGILDSKLDLHGSHVSMMACVSGLAKEGIAGDTLGLDWALIQAGAASLVSTHWSVGADAAADFFDGFYAQWIEGKQTRAAAFRGAMIKLLDGNRSAAALQKWTAFSLTGDFR